MDGERHQQDELWRPEPCRVCVCHKGVALCEELQCKLLSGCEKATTPEGACCPVCDTYAGASGQSGEAGLGVIVLVLLCVRSGGGKVQPTDGRDPDPTSAITFLTESR